MSFSECAAFANQHPVCAVATTDGDQPRVRYFMMWFADETGFYFHTGKQKNVFRQLQRNPKVELCFYDFIPPEQGGGRMLRASGIAEFVQDPAVRARLLEDRPWIRTLGTDVENFLGIFRVTGGEAWFWTMADNLREPEKFPGISSDRRDEKEKSFMTGQLPKGITRPFVMLNIIR